MKKRYFVLIIVLFLVIGFATLTTTLDLNGLLSIGYKEDDFDVYFSFVTYLENTDSSVEIVDKNQFIFTPNISEDDKILTVNYEIVNASHQYDTEVEVNCSPINQTATTINNNLENSLIKARDVGEGTVVVSLNENLTGAEDINDSYKCVLNTKAISRTEVDNSSIARFIEIDGKKTNVKEWRNIDLAYTSSTDTIYARSDDDYLYLYAENNETLDYKNIRLYFSTTASPSIQVYNYMIENNRAYEYNNEFTTLIGNADYRIGEGLEYKIPLSVLNVSSIDEINTIRLRYAGSSYESLKEFDIFLKRDSVIVDGNKTYVSEYTSEDIIYEKDDAIVYARILDDYIYFYAYDSSLSQDDLTNPSIYIGSRSDSVTKNPTTGYMIWYETSLLSCNSISCNNSIPDSNKYNPLRYISSGVEFKIPLSVLDMTTMNDLKVVKILYRNSSWQEIKSIDISFVPKYTKEDLVGKTYVLANKPSTWNNMFIYVPDNMSWPGEELGILTDADNSYVYILPDNIDSTYVVFSNNDGDQYPIFNQNLFKVEKGKSRKWNSLKEGLLSWSYVDSSNEQSDKGINFNLTIPAGKEDGGCVYLYDVNETLDKLHPWPGVSLTKDGTKYIGRIDDISKYEKVRVIFNNCGSWAYPTPDGVYVKPGATLTYNGTAVFAE